MHSKRYTVAIVLIVFILCADLYGDGCFVWNKGVDLYEPTQKAILYWKDGNEVMILQVRYEGPAEDFAWIVPLPSQPNVSAIDSDKSPFAEISIFTQWRRRLGYRGKSSEEAEEVIVLERKIVGVYDIAVLAASDATALNQWLNKNGYSFPSDRKDVLEHYTKKQWVYVAMRIDRKALASDEVKKLKVGELQPIRFSFAAKEMVYPLKISSINAGETEVLLYVLSDIPMVVKHRYMRPGFAIEENIPHVFPAYFYSKPYWDSQYGTYRKVAGEELPFTCEALEISKDKELSLCEYRSVFNVQEMTDDLEFIRFEPVAYWESRFDKEPNEQSYPKEKRKQAFTVLAWHDPSLLQDFADDTHSENRELVALHPKTPEKLLLKLAKDENLDVKHKLVMNKSLPLSVLRQLAKEKDVGLRCELARHPNLSSDLIQKFIRDENLRVRRYAVHHEAITNEMLTFLSKDEDEEIRTSVAYKNKTSVAVLKKLAHDKSMRVRSAVAQNSRLPAELAEELALDKSPEVRKSAGLFGKLSIKTLAILSNDENVRVRAVVAINSRTPLELLRKLANDKESGVRANVAKNPNVPIDILSSLAEDDAYWVRYCVACNNRTPTKTLLRLSSDKNLQVSQKANESIQKRKAD